MANETTNVVACRMMSWEEYKEKIKEKGKHKVIVDPRFLKKEFERVGKDGYVTIKVEENEKLGSKKLGRDNR